MLIDPPGYDGPPENEIEDEDYMRSLEDLDDPRPPCCTHAVSEAQCGDCLNTGHTHRPNEDCA